MTRTRLKRTYSDNGAILAIGNSPERDTECRSSDRQLVNGYPWGLRLIALSRSRR